MRETSGAVVLCSHRVFSQVLQHLGLSEVWDSRIGGGLTRGVSGGEKRRLSIATEILTRPALLFLDEPTTGLGKAIQWYSGLNPFLRTTCRVANPKTWSFIFNDVVLVFHSQKNDPILVVSVFFSRDNEPIYLVSSLLRAGSNGWCEKRLYRTSTGGCLVSAE